MLFPKYLYEMSEIFSRQYVDVSPWQGKHLIIYFIHINLVTGSNMRYLPFPCS